MLCSGAAAAIRVGDGSGQTTGAGCWESMCVWMLELTGFAKYQVCSQSFWLKYLDFATVLV